MWKRIVIVSLIFLVPITLHLYIRIVSGKVASADVPVATLSVFDPVLFGIPNMLAGYDVLAVQSSRNMYCHPQGSLIIIVKTIGLDEEANQVLNALSKGVSSVRSQLATLPLGNVDIILSNVSPSTTKDYVINSLTQQDALRRQAEDCESMRLGTIPNINMLTPFPTTVR